MDVILELGALLVRPRAIDALHFDPNTGEVIVQVGGEGIPVELPYGDVAARWREGLRQEGLAAEALALEGPREVDLHPHHWRGEVTAISGCLCRIATPDGATHEFSARNPHLRTIGLTQEILEAERREHRQSLAKCEEERRLATIPEVRRLILESPVERHGFAVVVWGHTGVGGSRALVLHPKAVPAWEGTPGESRDALCTVNEGVLRIVEWVGPITPASPALKSDPSPRMEIVPEDEYPAGGARSGADQGSEHRDEDIPW